MVTRRIDVPAWIEDPNTYTMLITDQLKLGGAETCEPDKIASAVMSASWPKERGSYEILRLDDPRFAEALDAAARKLALEMDVSMYEIKIADRAAGKLAVHCIGQSADVARSDDVDETLRILCQLSGHDLTAYYFVRVALLTPRYVPCEACKGTGGFVQSHTRESGSVSHESHEDCIECRGEGEVLNPNLKENPPS